MPGLVLFLHGLMGDQNSWGTVPDYVRNSDLGANFEIATPEYSASLWSPSTIETSAQQLLTLVETKYPHHDPIFLVGHSLGGLVAREMCRQLLVNGPDNLLNKIPAAISLGTPLEGARWGNIFLRIAPLFSRKIKQLASPKHAFNDYRQAIRAAVGRKVRGPKQLHIQIEDDCVVRRHDPGHFTEQDLAAATIPRGHTKLCRSK